MCESMLGRQMDFLMNVYATSYVDGFYLLLSYALNMLNDHIVIAYTSMREPKWQAQHVHDIQMVCFAKMRKTSLEGI